MTSFLSFGAGPEPPAPAAQRRPRSCGQHDAVERQRLVAPLEGAGVEGCDRLVEALRHPAHRRRADRPAEQAKQDLAELASRKPEHEARQDRAVDLGERRHRRAPLRSGSHAACAAQKARCRRVRSTASTGNSRCGDRRRPPASRPLQPAIDRRRHLRLDDLRQGETAKRAIASPRSSLSLHGLHHLESSR